MPQIEIKYIFSIWLVEMTCEILEGYEKSERLIKGIEIGEPITDLVKIYNNLTFFGLNWLKDSIHDFFSLR